MVNSTVTALFTKLLASQLAEQSLESALASSLTVTVLLTKPPTSQFPDLDWYHPSGTEKIPKAVNGGLVEKMLSRDCSGCWWLGE